MPHSILWSSPELHSSPSHHSEHIFKWYSVSQRVNCSGPAPGPCLKLQNKRDGGSRIWESTMYEWWAVFCLVGCKWRQPDHKYFKTLCPFKQALFLACKTRRKDATVGLLLISTMIYFRLAAQTDSKPFAWWMVSQSEWTGKLQRWQ